MGRDWVDCAHDFDRSPHLGTPAVLARPQRHIARRHQRRSFARLDGHNRQAAERCAARHRSSPPGALAVLFAHPRAKRIGPRWPCPARWVFAACSLATAHVGRGSLDLVTTAQSGRRGAKAFAHRIGQAQGRTIRGFDFCRSRA